MTATDREGAARSAAGRGNSERPGARRGVLRGLAAAGAALACPAVIREAAAQSAQPVVIGGKAFTEQYVMAEITKQLFEKNGIPARTRVGYSTDAIRAAQLKGEVDFSWDYTWTGWSFHFKQTRPLPADEIVDQLNRRDRDNGLVWMPRSAVNNTYAFAVNLDYAAENCIHSMPELAQAVRNGLALRFASSQECSVRDDCLLGAQRAYNFEFDKSKILVMNIADTYDALRERRAEVSTVFTTDGKIPAYDLEILADPAPVFREYFLVPVARNDALTRAPAARNALIRLARAMDTATQQDLHYRIDVVGQTVDQVARYFITSKGL